MQNNQHPQGLYDIYDLFFVPFWRTKLFLLAVALIFFAITVWGAWVYWRKRKSRILTPWEEALSQLNHLQAKIVDTDPKDFYSTITDTLKKYLERRYNFILREKTDEEVVAYLSSSSLPEPIQEAVQEIFRRAVAYKFAQAQESVEQMSIDVQKAQKIIQQTIPQETKGTKR